ncbi:MAG: BON domain-containing protein [Burkholderiaceae bacterium]
MTMTKRIAAAVFTASMLALTGCASSGPAAKSAKTESPKEYVGDAMITTKVKAALVNDPMLKAREINVETYQGAVQLSGFVATREEAAKAGTVARGIEGVTSVKNDIRLK